MSQNDPAAFTLNGVGQLIYLISCTARCPWQTKNGRYFLPTIFRNIKAKKKYLCYQLTGRPYKKFKFAISNFVYKLHIKRYYKKLLRGEMGEKPLTKRPCGKPKKVNWILSFDFRKVLFLLCFFMSTFTVSNWCIVYTRVSLLFLAFSFFSLQLIYRLHCNYFWGYHSHLNRQETEM